MRNPERPVCEPGMNDEGEGPDPDAGAVVRVMCDRQAHYKPGRNRPRHVATLQRDPAPGALPPGWWPIESAREDHSRVTADPMPHSAPQRVRLECRTCGDNLTVTMMKLGPVLDALVEYGLEVITLQVARAALARGEREQ